MKDALSFAGEKASRLVSSGYINMATHAPNLFRCLYAAGGLVSTSRSKSPVYWANVSYTDALHRYILDKGFDTIITPHLFPAEALTHLLRKHPLLRCCYGLYLHPLLGGNGAAWVFYSASGPHSGICGKGAAPRTAISPGHPGIVQICTAYQPKASTA